jgi:Uncharacterized conserved protein
MKVGKVAAFAVGGGIILLQVANHQGYIKINWDKVYKQVDKVEEKATGRGQKLMDKVEYIYTLYFQVRGITSVNCVLF